jgi:hypothetical protein
LSGSDVELVLQALVPVHDVRLTFLASDGTPWKAATLPLDPGRLRWSRPGSSDPEEPGDVSLPAGGVLRTTFRMPFLKKGLYEIVVKAEGTGDAGPIATEGMLRIAVGMPFPAAQEREGVAEFTTEVGR